MMIRQIHSLARSLCTCLHQQRCAVGRTTKKWVCASDLLCYREKDKEIGSLRSELAAARHRTHVDERASRVPSSIDTAGMSLQAQSQVERLEAANAKLEVRFEQSSNWVLFAIALHGHCTHAHKLHVLPPAAEQLYSAGPTSI